MRIYLIYSDEMIVGIVYLLVILFVLTYLHCERVLGYVISQVLSLCMWLLFIVMFWYHFIPARYGQWGYHYYHYVVKCTKIIILNFDPSICYSLYVFLGCTYYFFLTLFSCVLWLFFLILYYGLKASSCLNIVQCNIQRGLEYFQV